MDYRLHIVAPGPRPPYYQVAEHLWGIDCDIDSDGNSATPDDREWTELTVCLRSDLRQRVDVDPVSEDPQILVVCSSRRALCERVAEFIVGASGGEIRLVGDSFKTGEVSGSGW